MIHTIALDDEPPALDILGKFCSQVDYIDLTKKFSKASEAMKHLKNFPIDLVFLDINMPSISGLEFKKLLSQDTMVIFTTAYTEFAIEGFNLNAVDYLLKPFTLERFKQATEKAKAYYQFLHQSQSHKHDHLLIRVAYSLMKVRFTEIAYIEALDDYIKIRLMEGKPIVTRMTLKTLSAKLPQIDFVRVHRSFIVPLDKIENVRGKTIYINGNEIPIGISYEEKFFDLFGKK